MAYIQFNIIHCVDLAVPKHSGFDSNRVKGFVYDLNVVLYRYTGQQIIWRGLMYQHENLSQNVMKDIY